MVTNEITQISDMNARTEEVRQLMVNAVEAGDAQQASTIYQDHLSELGVNIVAPSHQNSFETHSQTLGSTGLRHKTTDAETVELANLTHQIHAITSEKVTLKHRQEALLTVQEEIEKVSAVLTLATSVTTGKTINEAEAAKLGAYIQWAASDFVREEIEHIASGATASYRKFTSENEAARFSIQAKDGSALKTQEELTTYLDANPNGAIFVYKYGAQAPHSNQALSVSKTEAEQSDPRAMLKSFAHRPPSNYPAALAGQAYPNTLSGGLSLIASAHSVYDVAAIQAAAAQRGLQRYYQANQDDLGLTDAEVDALSHQIQAVSNRGWETRVEQFSAVCSVGLGETLEQSRQDSDLPEEHKDNQAAELAGINAYYIHSDMDDQKEDLAAALAKRVMSGNGRVCVKPSVVLVNRAVYDGFKDSIATAFQNRHDNADTQIGLALSKDFKAGAIYSEEEYNAHAEFYQLLQDAGFETAGFEGETHDRAYSGIYASPFVAFAETDQHKQTVKDILAKNEEVFSAQTIIVPVDSVDEAIGYMNTPDLLLGQGAATYDADVMIDLYQNLKLAGSLHFNDFEKFISDNAPNNIHAHNPQYAPGEVKNTGVTGGLDGLSQLFENQARDLPFNNTRVPAAQARQFLNANGYNLPAAEIS